LFKKAQTLQETLQNIKAGQLFYPETMDSDLKNLLSNILNLNIKDRFSMDEILNHQFFNDKELRRIKYQRNFNMKNCQSTRNHQNSDFSLSSLGLFSCRAGKENLNQENLFTKSKKKEINVLDRRRTNTVHIGSKGVSKKCSETTAFVIKI